MLSKQWDLTAVEPFPFTPTSIIVNTLLNPLARHLQSTIKDLVIKVAPQGR